MSENGLIERVGKRLTAAAPFAAVAGLGALVIHQLAYAAATAAGQIQSTSDHGHLTAQWAVLTPLAVMGAVVLVLRQIRNLGYHQCRVGQLTAASTGIFIIQEAIEGAAQGSALDGVLTIPVLAGITLAPLVGAVIVRLLADVAEVVARFVATPAAVLVPTVSFVRPGSSVYQVQPALVIAPSRGPPVQMR